MKTLLALFLLLLHLQADEFDEEFSLDDESETPYKAQGYVGVNGTFFTNTPKDKNPNSFLAIQKLELDYTKDEINVHSTLYAQEAYYDFAKKEKQTGRTFARLDELFLKYDFDDSSIKMGKSIEFWGALEVYNATDVFNTLDFRNDITDANNKLGSWNINYSYYTEDGELSLIVKLYEESEAMPKYAYNYYFLPKESPYVPQLNRTFALRYDKELQSQHEISDPSLFLKYSASTDFALDYALVLEKGYDSQRFIDYTIPKSKTADIVFNSNIYKVYKLLTFNTLAVEDTLYKFEGVYAKVLDENNVSDYAQLSLGVEHTLSGFLDLDGDLGVLAEYYYYHTFESKKMSDLELYQAFQNDLFVGLRYTFNDEGDSTFLGGALLDTEYNEQLYTAEYERRLFDDIKLKFSYQYIRPSTTHQTTYALIGKHQKFTFDVSYHF